MFYKWDLLTHNALRSTVKVDLIKGLPIFFNEYMQ